MTHSANGTVPLPTTLAVVLGLLPSAVVAQSEIQAWGDDAFNQVSETPLGGGFVLVAAGTQHSMALQAGGSIVSWGDDSLNQVSGTPLGTGFSLLSAGGRHSLALRTNGSIVAWGWDNNGQVMDTPIGSGFLQVSAGVWHSMALRGDGSIAIWGGDDFGQVVGVPGGAGFTQVSAGGFHSVALRANGSIETWGQDVSLQVTNSPVGTGFVQVAGGRWHSVALRTDGSIVSWGADGNGQVTDTPTETGFTQVVAGSGYSMALRADGSIVAWGSDQQGQIMNAPLGTGYTGLSAGDKHALVLEDGGTGSSFCFGDGGNQMGCTNCPCGNEALVGSLGGCLNSAGASARLSAGGSPSVSLPSGSTTDLRFALSGAPANAFCILNSGDGLAPNNMANPCFGMDSGSQAAAFDGLRCAVLNTRRHGGRAADSNGDVGATNYPWGGEGGPPVGIAQAGGGFAAGQTRYFQVIHRDDPMAVCMRGLNTSQAVGITFLP